MRRVTIFIAAMALMGVIGLQAGGMKCGAGMMQKSDSAMMDKNGMHKCGAGMMQGMQETNGTKGMNKCGDGMMKMKPQSRNMPMEKKMMAKCECMEKMKKMMQKCKANMQKDALSMKNEKMMKCTMCEKR